MARDNFDSEWTVNDLTTLLMLRYQETSSGIHIYWNCQQGSHTHICSKLTAPIRNSVRTHLDQLPYLQGLRLAHPVTSDENFHIFILIGADFYWQFIQDRIIRGEGPTAVESRSGCLLSGPLPFPSLVYITCSQVLTFSCITEDVDCDNFWRVASMATTPMKQNTDILQDYLNSNVTVKPDGTYLLRFSWRTNHPPLPSNYTICAKRTRSMANPLGKTPHLLQLYNREQESRGFIERVSNHTSTRSAHHIPHHPVRKDSLTTPLRIVYDCSCKQSSNLLSLNDCLNPGPPFLNDLCAILVHFRQHNIAFLSDIEKAFLHVHLDEVDRDFTWFLWLSNPDDPNSSFVTYRSWAVLLGATCSPFMLNATIIYHLQQNDLTKSCDLIHTLYVDNVVSGTHSEETAIDYFIQSRSILGNANFNLHSCKQLNDMENTNGVFDDTNPVKVLGLWWDTHSDTIFASPKQDAAVFSMLATKREILKWTLSVFDPLGLISPVTITAKLFLK